MSAIVKVGQIWKDNDGRGVGFVRFVKVLALDRSLPFAAIQSCHENGHPLIVQRAPITRTSLSRFGKKGRTGFTLVRDV